MIVFGAEVKTDNQSEIANWKFVSEIILNNFTPEMQAQWIKEGFEGLFSLVPEHFGMTRMYRNKNSYITFEFTEEQWTMFLLKWV